MDKKYSIKTNKYAFTAFKHAIFKLPYAFKVAPRKDAYLH